MNGPIARNEIVSKEAGIKLPQSPDDLRLIPLTLTECNTLIEALYDSHGGSIHLGDDQALADKLSGDPA